MTKAINYLQNNPQYVNIFLKIFYTVGIIGIMIPDTSAYFASLTPLTLLMSFAFLLFYHTKFDANTLITFGVIAILGFVIEERGVNTGLIFGKYAYGDSLGYKLNNTPLLIGVNWLLMTYITASIFEDYALKNGFKIVGAALLMVLYDLVLEQVAPLMNMWSWEQNNAPIQNYIAWFALAVIFQTILKIRKIDTSNPISTGLLIIQFVFFLTLFLFL